MPAPSQFRIRNLAAGLRNSNLVDQPISWNVDKSPVDRAAKMHGCGTKRDALSPVHKVPLENR